jgi:protein deglycase
MKKKVLVLLAEGFEEIEAITPIDYLRRAGADVQVVALGASPVRSSRGVLVHCDIALADMLSNGDLPDCVIVPGGMPGASNIATNEQAMKLIYRVYASGALVGAICAAPAVVLHPAGILLGKRFTCFPGMEERVSGAQWQEDRVVCDGNIITSRGAGTAGEWAIALIAALYGDELAQKIASQVLLLQP